MIVRTWRAEASNEGAVHYARHFHANVLPALRLIDGFAGASLLRSDRDGTVEFLVLTRWSSMQSIRAFAGAEPERAKVEAEAVAALLRFDQTVNHYEVVEEA